MKPVMKPSRTTRLLKNEDLAKKMRKKMKQHLATAAPTTHRNKIKTNDAA
jgi:hypothetical protein